jgi:hypothetical protein
LKIRKSLFLIKEEALSFGLIHPKRHSIGTTSNEVFTSIPFSDFNVQGGERLGSGMEY